MYLNIGNNEFIRKKNIIGIFDIDRCTVSKRTRELLFEAEKKGIVKTVGTDLPKSFVVCSEKDGMKIYISKFSPVTLTKRIEEGKL